MDEFIIEGGQRLEGEVTLSGAKNAVLAIMAATILAEGTTTLTNVPNLRDTRTITALLQHLGAEAEINDGRAELKTDGLHTLLAPYDLVSQMRASFVVLGPMLTRYGEAEVSLPGGCAIGDRPVNIHLDGLTAMGAEITQEHGYVKAKAPQGLKGADIFLDLPTVGGTENILMAATLARGQTIIRNAAREPEVEDLARFLTAMGADIKGAGSDTIQIVGVKSLKGISYEVMADRIEAGTFMIAAGITNGRITIKKAPISCLTAVEKKLKQTGCAINHLNEDTMIVAGPPEIRPVDIKTEPYPGFPTDLQAQFMALMSRAKGLSVIKETIFEDRFIHVNELKRLGADIRLSGNTAIIEGVKKLSGAPVMATDLRASASLILAGMAAEGQTELSRVYHIDRGYEKIEEKLTALGANIRRVQR